MAADMFGNLPPELYGDAEALKRRDAIAQAMLQQGMSPIQAPQNKGRLTSAINPLQGLEKIASAYFANAQTEGVNKDRAALGTKYQDMLASEVAKVTGLQTGSAPRPQVMGADDMAMIADQGGQANPTVQDVKPDAAAAMNAALASPIPAVRKIGDALLQQRMKGMEPYTLPAGAQRRGPNGEIIAQADFRPDPGKTFKVGDTRSMRDGRSLITQEYQGPEKGWVKISTGEIDRPANTTVNNPAPVSQVTIADPKDPTGRNTIVVDGRTYKGGGLGSPGVIGAGPKMTEAGRIDAKAMKAMSGLASDLQVAEDLLTGVVRTSDGQVVKGDLPTGSGAGSIVDSVAGFVGITPKGAKEADSLKVVSARLVGKVPRFEGPQSDKDTLLYKEAAGNAGNEKIPRDRRLEAIRTMRQIYAGYETGERGRIAGQPGGAGAAATGATPPPPPGFTPNP